MAFEHHLRSDFVKDTITGYRRKKTRIFQKRSLEERSSRNVPPWRDVRFKERSNANAINCQIVFELSCRLRFMFLVVRDSDAGKPPRWDMRIVGVRR